MEDYSSCVRTAVSYGSRGLRRGSGSCWKRDRVAISGRRTHGRAGQPDRVAERTARRAGPCGRVLSVACPFRLGTSTRTSICAVRSALVVDGLRDLRRLPGGSLFACEVPGKGPMAQVKTYVALVVAVVTTAGIGAQRGQPTPVAPRQVVQPPRLVVFLVVDQMRADYVNLYGHQWTKGLRRLVD